MAQQNTKTPRMADWLSTGQFGAEVGRTAKCVRDWIATGVIPPDAVRVIQGRYQIRRWAIDVVTA